MIKFQATAVSIDAAQGDQPSRTISGIAVPYGETAIVSDGTAVRIEAGALPVDGKAPKLFMYHDSTQPVGLVTARTDTDAGMLFTAKISATAAGDVLTTDTPGLLPVPVLGPVFDDLNYIRPVVAAVGARAMPDGGQSKTWIRPTWTTHTSVGSQSPELSGVSATTPVIASNVVTKTTLAGQVTLSVQDIDFTSPAALEIILRDLAGQYMLQSDAVAANAITAGASASGSTWSVTANDPSTLIAALYDAATDCLTATNFLPDHIFVSTDVWKKLGSQLDADKRPVFPYVGAAGLMGVNGMGTANVTQMNTFNPLGLNLVVDRAFGENTMVVARGTAIEFYEQVRGIMSVEVPATLGRTFSYYGYVSTFIADADQVKSIAIG